MQGIGCTAGGCPAGSWPPAALMSHILVDYVAGHIPEETTTFVDTTIERSAQNGPTDHQIVMNNWVKRR